MNTVSAKVCFLKLNPLSADPTKWSNTLKQFVGTQTIRRLMYGDGNPFFIEISVPHFSIGGQEFCLLEYDYLIAFKAIRSLENFTYTLRTLR